MPRFLSKGFSLIEILVALMILAFALLGMLSVFINSLKLSASSGQRSVAAQQAYAIAEILRANPAEIAAFAAPGEGVQANCLKSVGCAATDYVSTAFHLWQGRLAEVLPQGQGTLCRDNDPANHLPTVASSVIDWNCDNTGQFVVKICWDESRIAASRSAFRPGSTLLCTWTNL